MSNQTCTEHGNTVVVYQGDYRSSRCPLCAAETELDDLKQKIEDLEAERDSLASEVDNLKGGAMSQDEFIENYVTTFLATWAAQESKNHPSGQTEGWMKKQPVEEDIIAARYAWYSMLEYGLPLQTGHTRASTRRFQALSPIECQVCCDEEGSYNCVRPAHNTRD